jgi:K+-transporting ATPase ATPase C chain
MGRDLLIALRTAAVTLLLTGLVYPLVITGIAQLFFPWHANGSLVRDDRGVVVGSALIAQGFANPAYFQPRPSAAGAGYDATASGGSNFGPTSSQLRARVLGELHRLALQNPGAAEPVPAELVTASGSGLDPHLSPKAALWQVPRIAHARHVAPERVTDMVRRHSEGRDLGVLGEPRVNVLTLNLALDRQLGAPLVSHPAPPP